MHRVTAATGSAAFFMLVPSMVAGVIPWSLTGWHATRLPAYWEPVRALGVGVLACGLIVLVHAFVRFVAEGAGTPAPVAPTEHLVVGGFYRYVRNPMYVAVLAVIAGQALILGRPVLLGYAAAAGAAMGAFVRWYEEPVLARTFGDRYESYRRAVPGWLPRLRPWRPSVPRAPDSHPDADPDAGCDAGG